MKKQKTTRTVFLPFNSTLRIVLVISCSIFFLGLTSCKVEVKNNRLKGSWEIDEIHWKTKDTTYSILKAEPGIFFFTDSSYAIMWTPLDEPRRPFKILSKPTDDELIAGFRSVIFNAGSYIFTDTTVVSTAFIAKVPGFEGGKQFYRYTIEGNGLRLTMYDETYPDGKKPEWFGRYVTEFVLNKID